ncbi:MAG: PilZ domain-containing protein [Nitrospirota bacterium]
MIYHAGLREGHGYVWNLSVNGWCFSGDVPIRQGEAVSLTVTLPNEQRIDIPEAVVRWSRGQEFAVETVKLEQHTRACLAYYVKHLVRNSEERTP